MKRTSTEILESRDKLSKNITNTWGIIKSENVIDKGYTRNYDIKGLLKDIENFSNLRIIDKLDSLCINLGISDRKDFPNKSIYHIIYTLSEKNEMYVQLGLIKTINPKLKLKVGKNKLTKSEELTADYIAKLRDKLQIEINALKKKLKDYNATAQLTTDSSYNFKL